MNNIDNNTITSKQLTFFLVGSMIGIGAFSLPNEVVQKAKQSGWIAVLIGSIYPVLIVVLARYYIERFPNKNILALSKECFGSFIGTILNLIFAINFIFYITSVSQGLSNLFLVSIAYFLNPIKILSIIIFSAAYGAYKDLKILAKVNALTYFLTILLSLILLAGFKSGDYKNLLPIFDCGLKDIISATKETIFSYTGIEVFFLIYPFVTDKNKAISASFKAVFITVIIYIWFVLITIYFAGINLTPKFLWPITMVPKAISIAVISNFRFVFLVLWCIIIIKTITNFFFAATFIVKDSIKDMSKKIIFISLFVICTFISTLYKEEVTRRAILSYLMPISVIFNVSYILIILVLTYFKKDDNHEV
ncbi:GerAB/ArcD/ProY family transporter [Desnuesiella massiliensis]|uniref:GerAB/ArcD/ProY family transporter n=1 Tax=Desnuesiella massiliensis TaxID=1650662 RepID=UPI0006E4592E|nr:endospore germination permease [Desnuesiella massiliensis]